MYGFAANYFMKSESKIKVRDWSLRGYSSSAKSVEFSSEFLKEDLEDFSGGCGVPWTLRETLQNNKKRKYLEHTTISVVFIDTVLRQCSPLLFPLFIFHVHHFFRLFLFLVLLSLLTNPLYSQSGIF